MPTFLVELVSETTSKTYEIYTTTRDAKFLPDQIIEHLIKIKEEQGFSLVDRYQDIKNLIVKRYRDALGKQENTISIQLKVNTPQNKEEESSQTTTGEKKADPSLDNPEEIVPIPNIIPPTPYPR